MELRSGLQKSYSFLIPVRCVHPVISPAQIFLLGNRLLWTPQYFCSKHQFLLRSPPLFFLDEDVALWNKKAAGSCFIMGLLSIMAGSTRAEPARFQDGHRRPSHWVVNSIRAGILSLLLACGTPGPSTLLASQRHLPSVAEWMAHSLTDQLNEAMSLLSVLMTLLHSVAWFSSLPQPLFLFLPLLSFGGLFFFFFCPASAQVITLSVFLMLHPLVSSTLVFLTMLHRKRQTFLNYPQEPGPSCLSCHCSMLCSRMSAQTLL